MEVKTKIGLSFASAALFVIAYIFIFALPISEDVFFEPIHSELLDEVEPSEASVSIPDEELFPFVLRSKFGYFTQSGKIVRNNPAAYYTTVSEKGYAHSDPQNTQTDVYAPDGTMLGTIPVAGFVRLDNNRAYVFEPGGNTVSCYTVAGERVWQYGHTGVITAFHSTAAGAVIGFSDGKLVYILPDGRELFGFYPGGSKYEIIFGAAISQDGTMAACVSGIEPQRVILIDTADKQQYKIIHHSYLEKPLTRRAFMSFDSAGAFLLFERADGLGIIDCGKRQTHRIKQKGTITAAYADLSPGLFTVLTHEDSQYTLSLIRQPSHVLSQTSFTAHDVFFTQKDNRLFLAMDNRLVSIDIQGIPID